MCCQPVAGLAPAAGWPGRRPPSRPPDRIYQRMIWIRIVRQPAFGKEKARPPRARPANGVVWHTMRQTMLCAYDPWTTPSNQRSTNPCLLCDAKCGHTRLSEGRWEGGRRHALDKPGRSLPKVSIPGSQVGGKRLRPSSYVFDPDQTFRRH